MELRFSSKVNINGNSYQAIYDSKTGAVKRGYGLFIGKANCTNKKAVNNIADALSVARENKELIYLTSRTRQLVIDINNKVYYTQFIDYSQKQNIINNESLKDIENELEKEGYKSVLKLGY